MAIHNFTPQTTKPGRSGNDGFGELAGTFTSTESSNATYNDLVTALGAYFQPDPPIAVVYGLNGSGTDYSFIARGRVV